MNEYKVFREALEQSRKGEPLNLSQEEFELFSAIQNDGIAKCQSLDRPELEKEIDTLLHNYEKFVAEYGNRPKDIIYNMAVKLTTDYYRAQLAKDKQNCDKKLQMMALNYDTIIKTSVEEAKREERERIVMGVEEKWVIVNAEGQFPYFKFDYGDWQSLKGGVK